MTGKELLLVKWTTCGAELSQEFLVDSEGKPNEKTIIEDV